MNKVYLTTPIYYVNALPHLGHAYTTLLTDTMSRFYRLRGDKVFFLTGTDEHGDKIVQSAAKAGEPVQAYVDRISNRFKELWEHFGITYNRFIRTTEPAHQQVVQAILQQLHQQGDIYFGEYEGKYCFGCERFYLDKELVDGKCPDHQQPPTPLKEQNYFFRMSRYQKWLQEYVEKYPDFIRPEHYRNEVLGFLREPLGDLCISRPKSRLTWGIPLPFDERYVTYVWFDALINYISGVGGLHSESFREFWPVAQHNIAKDILKPHAIYWPTMLKAAGIEPFHHLNVHGYWRIDQSKMSKSVGKVVNPKELADKYSLDALRYFLLREMTFGLDANFSEDALVARLNADLANDLGNLLHRTLHMIERYQNGTITPNGQAEPVDESLQKTVLALPSQIQPLVERLEFHNTLATIWESVRRANTYLEETAPWTLNKQNRRERLSTVLYNTAEALRILTIVLSPFIPRASAKMWEQLGLTAQQNFDSLTLDSALQWKYIRADIKVKKGEPLFPRVEKPE